MATDELACTFASLILSDDGIPITSEKISALVNAANVKVDPYRATLFTNLLEKKSVDDIITGVASGGGGASATAAVAVAASSVSAAAPATDFEERVRRQKEYRQKILSAYQPLHRELYNMQPEAFFVPSLVRAIIDNSEENFRRIISEPARGVYTFAVFQPYFCEMLLDEVEHFEQWANTVKFKIMRPTTMNKFGAVLDDIGLEPMLKKLMDDFICPISSVLFPDVGGSSLDSHHGFVVEYGEDKDVELGFHVDDSEVTLNVCLGRQFSGGELFFRGIRCDKHVNSESQPEEILDFSPVPGQAVLHRSRHRNGALTTTSGQRMDLLLWCRSSVFREMKKYQKDFSSWCGECEREKERQWQSVAATKLEFQRGAGGSVI